MGLFDSIKGKMAENKEKTERAYEEAMNYNQELNFAFEYAVRKAVETSDHAR